MRVPSGVELSVEATSFNGFLSLTQSVGVINSGMSKDVGHISACVEGNTAEFYEIYLGAGWVFSTVLSADGMLVAISGYEEVSFQNKPYFTSVYDTRTGIELCKFTKDSIVEPVNFSDDGTKLLIRWRQDSAIIVNPVDGAVIQSYGDANLARMLPDGSAIIVVKNQGTLDSSLKLRLYSAVDGSKIKDLSFDEIGLWSLEGTRGSSQVVLYNRSKKYTYQVVMYWDIATDSKTSEVQFTSKYGSSDQHSTRFSYISLPSKSNRIGDIDFYNTQTGATLNSSAFDKAATPSRDGWAILGLANDLTFAFQPFAENGQSYPPPTIYSVAEGKLVKVLAVPKQFDYYAGFTYSANSHYVAASQGFFSGKPSLMVIRIWKVK